MEDCKAGWGQIAANDAQTMLAVAMPEDLLREYFGGGYTNH